MSMIVLKIEASPRSMHRTRGRNGRQYVSGRNVREFYQASRVYVWPRGESILENLCNRRSRPYTEYRKLLAGKSFMEKARWSQKAGCSCGCSPGFILDRTLHKDDKPVDFHVEVADEKDVYNAVGSIAQMTAALEEPANYLDLVAA